MDTVTQLENVTVIAALGILRMDVSRSAVIALTSMSVCMGQERCDSYFLYCLRPFGTVVFGCLNNEIRAISAPNEDDGPGIDFSLSKVLDLSNPQNFPGLGDTYEVSCFILLPKLRNCLYYT